MASRSTLYKITTQTKTYTGAHPQNAQALFTIYFKLIDFFEK